MPGYIDYHFIIRVLKDEVSPEEKEFFEVWLSESEKNREDFSAVALLWDKIGSSKNPPIPDPFAQWFKIVNEVSVRKNAEANLHDNFDRKKQTDHLKVLHFDTAKTKLRKRVISGYIIKAAAIIILGIFSTLFFISIKEQQTQKQIQLAEVNKPLEVSTRKGEKITLTLYDGTKVYLNSDSKIIYPSFFDKKSRHIELIGEAYFSVVRDTSRPFSVVSGNTITVVRGTEFNIKNRGKSISVVVAKGSVDTYSNNSDKVYNLRKGDMTFYSDASGFSKPRKVNLKQYLAWRDDKLAFSRTALNEVMEEIERYYNVDITFGSDSLKHKTLTGIFNTDSIDHILSIISLTLDLKIERNGREIIVNNN